MPIVNAIISFVNATFGYPKCRIYLWHSAPLPRPYIIPACLSVSCKYFSCMV